MVVGDDDLDPNVF